MEDRADQKQDLEGLRETLRQVERRLARVEHSLGMSSGDEADGGREAVKAHTGAEDVELEFRIGELWLGQMGVVALLIGIAFFISYSFGPAFPPVLQIVAGYLGAGGFFLLSRRWNTSHPNTSRILLAGSLSLLYFATLRLHFFTRMPIVPQKAVGLGLLVLVLGFLIGVAIARRSQGLASLALVLGLVTSLCSDTSHFALAMMAATSAAAVFLGLAYSWTWAAIISGALVYPAHLIWMLNNPVLGRPVQAVPEHHFNLVYLFVCAGLFGLLTLFRRREKDPDAPGVVISLLNVAGFYAVSVAVGATYFRALFAEVNFLVAVFFMALAVLHWVHRQARFSTALYACSGYIALSVAIVARFDSPERFIWLGWQSLLVICTAIWFRSKTLVVANLFIYLGILLLYLLVEAPDLGVNLSYAAVALLSARVMNWKKERLTIRTELMRNVYLGSAFVIIPYGLYHRVPRDYVSLSWLGAGFFYYGMSIVLRNRKYRWMAILTLFLTILHVLVVDLAGLNPVLRMISFLALGVGLMVLSWLYARNRRQASHG